MKKKYLGLVAATLLGVTPVANLVVNATQPAIVHAADDEDQTASLWLKKKTPYLTANNGESVKALIRRPIRDVTSNVSKVTSIAGIAIYHNMDNGDPDYTETMNENDILRKGQSYSAVLTFHVKHGEDYSRLLQGGDDYDPYHYGSDHYKYEWDNDDNVPSVTADDYSYEDVASIVVPIRVVSNTSKSTVTKINAKGYVKGKKNAKVKTYTSTGKVTKTKVYGRHTYKLNQKKVINGRVHYKVYGKSYWIRASNLVIK